ncbi:uncharacterized protein [Apostichopus japonicus]|uniref:uncharacterized protein n=1 Tax=Stichopus japonicus TaxID=307972 RepID=UPI003AB5C9EA
MTVKCTPALTLVLYLVTFAVRSANSECPNGCECRSRPSQVFPTISCSGLDVLPNLPKEVSDLTIVDSLISEIPPGYFNQRSLTDLNLSNNDLETISKESFEYVGSLQNIDLSMNPIVCNQEIEWLQVWRKSYPKNEVIGNCTNGNTISSYLDDKPGAAFTISLGDDDLTFGRACESLYIAATADSAATSAMTYRFTYLPDEGSEGDLEIDDDEVTLPAGADSMVINVRVNDGGSAGDPQRSYLLVLVPKSITAVGTEMKIILEDGVSTCSTVQTTVSPTVQTTVSPTVQTTVSPTVQTTVSPTVQTTVSPTVQTTVSPTVQTTVSPTVQATVSPTVQTTVSPTVQTTVSPTVQATVSPTVQTTVSPSTMPPTEKPKLSGISGVSTCSTVQTTVSPTVQTTVSPTVQTTVSPTVQTTVSPTVQTTVSPTVQATVSPTVQTTVSPSTMPPTEKPKLSGISGKKYTGISLDIEHTA